MYNVQKYVSENVLHMHVYLIYPTVSFRDCKVDANELGVNVGDIRCAITLNNFGKIV